MDKRKKDLCNHILNISEIAYVPFNEYLSKAEINDQSKEFMKCFFDGDNIKYDINIKLFQDDNLKDFDGYVKETGFNINGMNEVSAFIAGAKTPATICALTHEKVHAYHLLRERKTNEIAPSFIEIINAKSLNDRYQYLFQNDLSYKISCAKKSAKNYLKYWYLGDKRKNNVYDYMMNFIITINLLERYFEDEKSIKELVKNDVFITHNSDALKSFYDVNNIDEKIKKISLI